MKYLKLRKKTLVPSLLFVAGAVLFSVFLLDKSLKFGLTKALEIAGGAEVNVASLNLSILDGSLKIEDIEITDPSKPEYNLVSIGDLTFDLSSSGLLKLKFIVEEANILDIVFSGKREKAGWVEEINPTEEENLTDAEKSQPKILRTISKLVLGFNPAADLEKIDINQLPSLLKANGLKSNIQEKNAELSTMVSKLPTQQAISQSSNELRSIGKSRDIKLLQNDLQTLKKNKSEASSYVSRLTAASAAVTAGAAVISKSISNLDGNIDGDLNEVLNQLNLPDLEFKGLAKELFGKEIDSVMHRSQKYYELVKPYIDSKKEEAKVKETLNFRLKGKRVVFSNEKLPVFWLKNAAISSLKETDSYKDEISGKITNFSSSIEKTKEPMLFEIAGSIGSIDLDSVAAKFFMEKVEKGVRKDLRLEAFGVKVENRELSDADSFKLAIKQARANITVTGTFLEQQIDIKAKSEFLNPKFDFSSDEEKVVKTIGPIIGKVSKVTLNAKGQGSLDGMDWSVESNLADVIKNGLKQTLSDQVNSVRKSVTRKVRDEIGKKKKELYTDLRKMQTKYTKEITDKLKVAKEYENTVKAKYREVEKKIAETKRAIESKVKSKATDKLKNSVKGKIPGF